MKVAVCQSHIYWEDKIQNIEVARTYINQASVAGVDLILFPEMSFTGFSMNLPVVEETMENGAYYTVSEVKKMSIAHSIHVGFGWVRKGSDAAENHYTIINPKGEVISDYIKIHPFSYSKENLYFKQGDHLGLCKIKDQWVSTFICYDLRFPEIFQAASKKAEIIVVAANWPETRKDHFSTLLKARAIENQCYIVACNCVGQMNHDYYSGNSSIIAPDGTIVNTMEDKEGLIIEELSMNVKEYRKSFPVKQDRQESLYHQLQSF